MSGSAYSSCVVHLSSHSLTVQRLLLELRPAKTLLLLRRRNAATAITAERGEDSHERVDRRGAHEQARVLQPTGHKPEGRVRDMSRTGLRAGGNAAARGSRTGGRAPGEAPAARRPRWRHRSAGAAASQPRGPGRRPTVAARSEAHLTQVCAASPPRGNKVAASTTHWR